MEGERFRHFRMIQSWGANHLMSLALLRLWCTNPLPPCEEWKRTTKTSNSFNRRDWVPLGSVSRWLSVQRPSKDSRSSSYIENMFAWCSMNSELSKHDNNIQVCPDTIIQSRQRDLRRRTPLGKLVHSSKGALWALKMPLTSLPYPCHILQFCDISLNFFLNYEIQVSKSRILLILYSFWTRMSTAQN